MAQIFLSTVGAAVGDALLPGGFAAFGLNVSGAAIGQTIGTLAGSAIDAELFASAVDVPRPALSLTESREGTSLPMAFGRVRVPGQVIWATRFNERRDTERVGGKSGPDVTEYSYTISLAVAICEGEIQRIDRAWANGEAFALSDYPHRLYTGTADQMPDPLIEAVEGQGAVPAYRGTAYVVFEDFPLSAFGNRLPQLSFEVVRVPPSSDEVRLGDFVEAVNLIPASGEFVYATEPVVRRFFPGSEVPENVHAARGRADLCVSLDQLEADLPGCRDVSVVVGWFGLGDEAASCDIRPGVETRDKVTSPWSWRCGGVSRGGAHLISQDDDGHANYGGTPDDRSVVQGLRELVQRGFGVTITPFLFMDTPGFPWRGRLLTAASDGTAGARTEIEAFFGSARVEDFSFADDGWSIDYSGPAEWSYRRFVLHQAWLAKRAGGVSAFLIGSEMVGLTRLRDPAGAFPFVDGLVDLAADVRAILGPHVAISYAADWTEYGAFAPSDGSSDVLFPLDRLWADENIDYVGIDWYPPMGDWRDGSDHLDALAGWDGPDDAAYLSHQVEGGEGFAWYYASAADREAQIRTPIRDTAHGEDWVFRPKDLKGWWSHAHHERPGGTRRADPTAWQPGSKPVRLCEVGVPAVDKGANQPNVFFDPKSSESALPHFSAGSRDDLIQRRALAALHAHWRADPNSPVSQASVWAWDARPWPEFPLRTEVWSDGGNWARGHWLNGRAGLVTLRDIVRDVSAPSGVPMKIEGLSSAVEGYLISGPVSARQALEPLMQLSEVRWLETEDGLQVSDMPEVVTFSVAPGRHVEARAGEGILRTREGADSMPSRVSLAFIDGGRDHQAGEVSLATGAPGHDTLQLSLPVVMSDARATALAASFVGTVGAGLETIRLALGPEALGLDPGDLIAASASGLVHRIDAIDLEDDVQVSARTPRTAPPVNREMEIGGGAPARGILVPEPDLILLDLPVDAAGAGLGVAAFALPWPGRLIVSAGPSATAQSEILDLSIAARVGHTLSPLNSGPVGRWDNAATLHLVGHAGWPGSANTQDVLAGRNRLAIDTGQGWEVIGFTNVDLVRAGEFRVSGLLRGLDGSDRAMVESIPAGARVVMLDRAVQRIGGTPDTLFSLQVWTAASAEVDFRYTGAGRAPWRPVHGTCRRRGDGGLQVSWVPRGADIPADLDAPDPVRTARYRVSLISAETVVAVLDTAATDLILAANDLPAEPVNAVQVVEIDTQGRESPPCRIAADHSA